jgi:hypothetical protein
MQTGMPWVGAEETVRGRRLFAEVPPVPCEMRRSYATSKLVRVEWLCQPRFIFAYGVISHLREEIL